MVSPAYTKQRDRDRWC